MAGILGQGLLGLQGILEPATANPNMMAQAANARAVNPRPVLPDYQMAQMAGMIPGAGLLGILGDIGQYMEKPETRGILNYGLTALGAVPFLGAMAKMAGPLPMGIPRSQAGAIAYHGSPHSFDKFDMSKVGTGEGAQAYGHGLYFAESPGVAKSYQEKLGNLEWKSPEAGKRYDPDTLRVLEKELIHKSRDEVMRLNKQYADHATETGRGSVMADMYNALKNEDLKAGNLYKVDIPDEQIGKMLDWDKPLSQQSPELLSSINKLFGYDYVKAAPAAKVQDLYSVMSMKFGGEDKAAQILKAMGIPGISYLDQGSRATGQGTRNFVVFDDRLPKIIGRE